MGLRLANRDVSDCDRTPSKRDPRLRREVRASRGMLIRDIAENGSETLSEGVGFGSFSWAFKGKTGWKEGYSGLFVFD